MVTIVRSVPIVMIAMECIPVPSVHPTIVMGIAVKVIVGSRIYIQSISIVIHEPVIYTAIIPQVPIEIARKQTAWRLEAHDACRIGVIVHHIKEVIGKVGIPGLIGIFVDILKRVDIVYHINLLGTLHCNHLFLFLRHEVHIVHLCHGEKRRDQHQQ